MSSVWERLGADTLATLRMFEMRRKRFVSPRNKHSVEALVIDCPDWVNVVALTPESEVVLIRQFRFGSESVTLEIPGGLIDPGESPFEAARRELREETGYVSERWTDLGAIAPNPALQSNWCYTFLAENALLAEEQELDDGEDIEVVLHGVDEVPGLLADGGINHALVAVAFQKYELLLNERDPSQSSPAS